MTEARNSNGREDHRKRRFGRPPKPAELVRSERVVTFVTPTQLDALRRLSDRWETSVSEAVHRLVNRALEAENHVTEKSTRRKS